VINAAAAWLSLAAILPRLLELLIAIAAVAAFVWLLRQIRALLTR
jgi:hypothetical protein